MDTDEKEEKAATARSSPDEREGTLSGQEVVFGFGAHSGLDEVPELLRMAQRADRDGLDIFSLTRWSRETVPAVREMIARKGG